MFTKKEEARRRYDICKSCDQFKEKWCQSCGCYLPAKVIVAFTDCPLKKWNKTDFVKTQISEKDLD